MERLRNETILKLNLNVVKIGMDFMNRLPMRGFGESDEVARVILFSDLASYVHGAVIPVDGGFLSA